MTRTTDDRRGLRAAAEARLARAPASAPRHHDESRLLYELQVHQVELDIQTEELRSAQVALEEAHAKQVDLYDFAPVGYLTLDAKGLVAEANLTAAGMLNLDRRDLVGKSFGQFVGGDSATWRRFLHEVARSGDSRTLDLPVQRGDGSVFDGHLVCQHRAEGVDGGSVRVVLSDVSEQRSLEEKLGESQRYLELLRSHPVPLMMVDGRRKTVRINEAFTRVLGYTAEEVSTPDEWFTRAYPDEAYRRQTQDAWNEAVQRVAAGDAEIGPVERRITIRSGAERMMLVSGKLVGESLLFTFVDITERKRAEEALAVSEAKYRGLFDSMMDGVVVVEMAGTIVESNETYRKMIGYSADELRELTYRQLTPEPWHAMEARIVAEQILPRGHSDVYEKEYRRKDGTVFPVELRTFLLRENGRPSAMWAIVRDLTERKRAEQSMRVHEARLDLAVRSGKTGLWDWTWSRTRPGARRSTTGCSATTGSSRPGERRKPSATWSRRTSRSSGRRSTTPWSPGASTASSASRRRTIRSAGSRPAGMSTGTGPERPSA